MKIFKLNNRYGYRFWFDKTIKEFRERRGKTIVELGSIREETPRAREQDGHSTMAWITCAETIYSIDNDPMAIEITRCMTDGYNVVSINQDAIEFLEKFNYPIDLLYFDAWEETCPNCKSKHLESYLAAKKNLHEKTLLLFNGKKGDFVIPEAIQNGFKIIFQDSKTLFGK